MSNRNSKSARGYVEYQNSLFLSVGDMRLEYGEASSDDLSSDWDTESEEQQCPKQTKVRSGARVLVESVLQSDDTSFVMSRER